MPHWILRRIRDGGVTNVIEGKALTRILNPAAHHSAGADVGNLDVMPGIKVAAMLECIEQYLAKRHRYLAAFRLWQVGNFVKELQQAVRCRLRTADREANPARRRRENFNPI